MAKVNTKYQKYIKLYLEKIIIFSLIVFFDLSIYAQDENIMRFSKKLNDNTNLFIDNSRNIWYTIEIKTDTLFPIEKNVFFVDNKTMQIISLGFDNQNPRGTMGSEIAEKYALQGHKKWELDYQRKTIGKKLKNKEEFFYNKAGKPFLIWWYENPKKWKGKERTIEVYLTNDSIDIENDDAIELNCTHQLYMNFVIHGNILNSLSIPVLENENLQNEIEKLKNIANSLNVYGNYIDLKILSERINNPNYIFRDSLNLIEIEIPSWLNICVSPHKTLFSASFPEKDNITNAVAIIWELKSNFESFTDFKNKLIAKDPDINSLKMINKEKNKEQYFYTKNNGWFHCQNIFIEGENVYCYINFVATTTTYTYNLKKFYELVDIVKIK